MALDETTNRLAGIVARNVPSRRAEYQVPDESETTKYLVNSVNLLVAQARGLTEELERRTQKVRELRQKLLIQSETPLGRDFFDMLAVPPAAAAAAAAPPPDTGDLGRLELPSITVSEKDSDGTLVKASYEIGATVMGAYGLEGGGNAVWVGAITGQTGPRYNVGWFGVLGTRGVVSDQPSSQQLNFRGRFNRSFAYMMSDPDSLEAGSWCIVKE
jgi:hypothetical protein